jgi:hypothetical protein
MRERLEPALKILCAILAAVLLYQFGRLIAHRDPLAHLKIPALPTLAAETNAPAAGNPRDSFAGPAAVKSGTNTPSSSAQTTGKGTNAPGTRELSNEGTDVACRESASAGTNSVALPRAGKSATNSTTEIGAAKAETNSAVNRQSSRGGTNAAAPQVSGKAETNSAASAGSRQQGAPPGGRPEMAAMGRSPFGGPGGARLPDLAPPILARVDKVADSEILGPVMRPLPMALLGIAGNVAFLRSPSGQTGLVKEGDELSGLKLLRIGTNRVLVEQDGQQKELTIFAGYGGESLLPQQKENVP